MSLLDKATIITTPTAHSNGKLHSIKGGSVADFDVVRGSAATRVNAEGLIEDISVLSGELVTNGGFDTDNNWVKSGQVTIGGGVAHFDSDGTFTQVAQNLSNISGKNAKVVIEITEYTQGTLKVLFSGGAQQDLPTSIGVHTLYFTNVSSNTLNIARLVGVTNIKIDNISVKEIIDATNIPRIDYTTGEGVILTEPQSTNLLPHSNDFNHSAWLKLNGVALSNEKVMSPDGTLNAAQLFFDGTLLGRIEESIGGLTQGADYAVSVYARVLSGTQVVTFGSVSVSEYTLTTEWQRLTNTQVESNTTGYPRLICDDAATIEIYGFQLEESSYPTSYIPTSGAIATRLADSVTGAGDATTINSTEGVLYAEIAALANDGTIRRISLSNGTVSQQVLLTFPSTANRIQVEVINSTNQFFQNYDTGNLLDFNKIAISWKDNSFALWVNGVEVGTDISGLAPIGLNNLSFNYGNGTLPFYGKTKTIAVFSEALTDEELTCLTTI